VLDTYQGLSLVDDITLVINRQYEQLYYDIVDTYGCFKVRRMVPGGSDRQASSFAGLTSIAPCEIVVVQDGGGIAFTNELAYTVAAAGAHVDAKTLAAALRAEAIAYEKQLQTMISPATLCALQSSPCKK